MPPRLRVGPLLPKLRGQLAEFLHEGSLARLSLLSSPTCVGLRYGPLPAPARLFWAQTPTPGAPYGTLHQQERVQLPKRPLTFNADRGSRNINRVSIAYAIWPRLRPRLTLGGRTWPKKPEASGVADSHCHFRYSSRHSHLSAVQWSFRSTFTQTDNAPLPRDA